MEQFVTNITLVVAPGRSDGLTAFSWQSPGSESQRCTFCAEGPVGVTSSSPRLLHHEDWDRWYSCQSWQGWASGECVDIKQFSSHSHCCGRHEHSSELLPCLEPMGELEWYCHGLSWKWVPNTLEDEEKQTPFWATCQGLLILRRESALWKVTATNISQWYLDSSRKALVRLLYYFLTPSVLSVFPSPFWINNVCFKYNYSSASGYLYPEVSSNFPGAQRAHRESLPAQSWDKRFCGCNPSSFRLAGLGMLFSGFIWSLRQLLSLFVCNCIGTKW